MVMPEQTTPSSSRLAIRLVAAHMGRDASLTGLLLVRATTIDRGRGAYDRLIESLETLVVMAGGTSVFESVATDPDWGPSPGLLADLTAAVGGDATAAVWDRHDTDPFTVLGELVAVVAVAIGRAVLAERPDLLDRPWELVDIAAARPRRRVALRAA